MFTPMPSLPSSVMSSRRPDYQCHHEAARDQTDDDHQPDYPPTGVSTRVLPIHQSSPPRFFLDAFDPVFEADLHPRVQILLPGVPIGLLLVVRLSRRREGARSPEPDLLLRDVVTDEAPRADDGPLADRDPGHDVHAHPDDRAVSDYATLQTLARRVRGVGGAGVWPE